MTRALRAIPIAGARACAALSTGLIVSADALSRTSVAQGSIARATDIIRRWRVIIGTTFEERRAFAEEAVMDSIEIVISPGAVKVVQDNATEQQLKSADGLIQRFAVGMVAAGERLPDGSIAITEETIAAALAKVCPAYPLCPK